MPAETHQQGHKASTQGVLDLLMALLGDPADGGACSTLASLGVDDESVLALWDAVCEEFAERSLGPELDPGVIDVSMTLETTALIMAKTLSRRRRSGGAS